MKKKAKQRDPNWRWMRALGHKVVKDKTIYSVSMEANFFASFLL